MKTTQILIIAGIILTAGSIAFAWNGGYHMGEGYGYGHHMMDSDDGGYHMGPAAMGANLSDEDRAALAKERSEFIESTRELRKEAFNKQISIQKELSKVSPDFNQVEKLKAEISEINTQIDNIRNEYPTLTKIRKAGYGPHMRAGFAGNEYCW